MDEVKSTLVFDAKSKAPASTPTRKSSSGGFDFNSVNKRKPRICSPERREEILKEYEVVVVNDFNDEYHMSEEERKTKFRFYEAFAKVRRSKRKFQKLNEFVTAFRHCLECLDVVSEHNGVYPPDKFKSLVLRGEIEVFGLRFPKYVGKNRKDINWEYISKFILDNSLNPDDLVKTKTTELDNISDDELVEKLFTNDELQEFTNILQAPEDTVSVSYDESDENCTREDIVVIDSKKSMKKLIDMAPDVLKTVRDVVKAERKLRAIQMHTSSIVFDLTDDDMEKIEKFDRRYNFISDSDIPQFTGDIMNRKDYMKYMAALAEYERTQIKVNYNGKMRTQEEIDEIELKNALEEAGWNVRALYKKQNFENKLKKAQKEDRKREEALKKKLIKLQTRQKNRKKGRIEFDTKKKKKKHGKKKSKESKETD